MSTPKASQKNKPDTSPYPFWAPRFWHGMSGFRWWNLLAKRGFRVDLQRIPTAFALCMLTPFNDLLAADQWLRYSGKVKRTKLKGAPLFVIGHWRSGTTLLHELFGLDERFASPNTYQCFAPGHFLVSEWWITRFGNFLIPDKRPMDNMKAGWLLPQEDEFALTNLGAPSPYLRIAFPKFGPIHQNMLDMSELKPEELALWKDRFQWFLQALTVRYEKQLILKSPPHTGRIATLHEMFPESRFVHIVRDPRKLFPSTVRLWQTLDQIQGMQYPPPREQYEEFVFDSLTRMYRGFEAQRAQVPADRIVEISYESLIADPIGEMENLYNKLDLGGFETMRDKVKQRMESDRDYQTNKHALSADLEAKILSRWHDYAQRYGYLNPS